MPRFTPKRKEQILTQMIAKLVTRTAFSDVADTSTWKHVLAAAARSDDEQYYQMTLLLQLFNLEECRGEDLVERAKDIQPGIITKDEAQKAIGTVVFTRTTTVGSVAIAEDAEVLTSSGVSFKTTAAGSITATSPEQIPGHGVGRDSAPVAIVASLGGADGNVPANTIISFGTKPPGVDEVTNPDDTDFGINEESDDSFIRRIQNYVINLSRSTLNAMEEALLWAEDPDTGARILYVKAVEDPIDRGYVTIYIDDGTGTVLQTEAVTGENITEGLAGPPPDSATGGESFLFTDHKPINIEAGMPVTSSDRGALVQDTDYWVNPASGQVNFDPVLALAEVITGNYTRYTGLIEVGQKIIDGDPNDRVNYPGYRGGGILVRLLTPQILIQNVEVSITTNKGYDIPTVKTQVSDAIKAHINTLGISGDLLVSDLIKVIRALDGVYDVVITTPAGNVIILDSQMARTTDLNITVN